MGSCFLYFFCVLCCFWFLKLSFPKRTWLWIETFLPSAPHVAHLQSLTFGASWWGSEEPPVVSFEKNTHKGPPLRSPIGFVLANHHPNSVVLRLVCKSLPNLWLPVANGPTSAQKLLIYCGHMPNNNILCSTVFYTLFAVCEEEGAIQHIPDICW